MQGILFAFLGGACITLQGVINTRISDTIGTWQAVSLTQFVGFLLALCIWVVKRDGHIAQIKKVKPLYLLGGGFGALIIFSEVTAIQHIGVTFAISILLISQLCMAFLIDIKGWFGLIKQKMRLPQFLGIAIMIVGVLILSYK